MKTIHGYELNEGLKNTNAGFCQWGFCKKDGREFFIKEFLEPKYPVNSELFSPEAFERKIKICESFFEEKTRFYQALSECRTGNNVTIQDFFREGTKYYIVTDKIDASSVGLKEIASLSLKKKETLIRSILYSVAVFHEAGIIHSDIKADNILLKETSDGFFTAKIIDFDAGFLKETELSSVGGDLVYLSPEARLKINGEKIVLDEKIDIFALGILFHQIYTGELPKISSDDQAVFEAVLNGNPVELDDSIPLHIRSMIERMLARNPADRPSARDVLAAFEEAEKPKKPQKKAEEAATPPAEETSTEVRRQSRVKKSGFYVPTDLD